MRMARYPDPMSKRTLWIMVFVFGTWLMIVVATNSRTSKPAASRTHPPPEQLAPTVVVDSTILRQCKVLIRSARREGVLGDIRYREVVSYAIIYPDFYLLDFKTKEMICRAIGYSAKADGFGGSVILRDSRTDEKVGTFNEMIGSLEWQGGR